MNFAQQAAWQGLSARRVSKAVLLKSRSYGGVAQWVLSAVIFQPFSGSVKLAHIALYPPSPLLFFSWSTEPLCYKMTALSRACRHLGHADKRGMQTYIFLNFIEFSSPCRETEQSAVFGGGLYLGLSELTDYIPKYSYRNGWVILSKRFQFNGYRLKCLQTVVPLQLFYSAVMLLLSASFVQSQ